MQKTRLILLVVFFSVALWAAQAFAAPTQQTNLLQNPSFEDPYQGGVAQGWVAWHRESADPGACSGPYAYRPMWSRETNGALVVDGFVSQHVGNQYDTWSGGVWQTVSVNPGSTYRFTFSAIGRASNEQFPTPSDTAVNLGIRAGIDPNGSGLWSDSDVVWGGAGSPHDAGDQSNWQQFSVEATATGNQVTVFVSADLQGANNCRAHLDVWFDGAQLVEVGPPPTNTPPPQPTQPPPPPVTNTQPPPAQPTATTAPEETETPDEPTATPEPTATATDTPVPGGVICVNAFADTNSNGMHDEDEGVMAGVTFTVAQGNQVVGTAVSSGPNAICFDNLEPGTYQVAQTVPNRLQMTTGAMAEVEVGVGQTLEIKFGSRQRTAAELDQASGEDEVAGSDTVETGDGDVVSIGDQNPVAEAEEGSSLLAMSGLVVLLLAIVLLGVLLFTQLRKRA